MKTKNMEIKLLVIFLGYSLAGFSQTVIEKTVPVRQGQVLEMDFEYPNLIKLHTWDNSSISIKGDVTINYGENDAAFELQVDQTDQEIKITSGLREEERLPRYMTIRKEGKDYVFKASSRTDAEVQKFLNENGHEYSYTCEGIMQEITLEIFVPRNIVTRIQAKYGIVEVTDFNAPLTVNAPYGAIDVSVVAQAIGQLSARTKFGEILTNLYIQFESSGKRINSDWTEVSARPGSGPPYDVQSKYGKIYLRKPVN